MSPIAILERLLSIDRNAARVVFAGLGVLAAAAIAASFKIGGDVLFDLGALVLGFGAVLGVLAFILKDGALKAVVGWIVVLAGMTYGATVFAAGVIPGLVVPPLNPVDCIVKFWVPCRESGGPADAAAVRAFAAVGPPPQVQPLPPPSTAAGQAVLKSEYEVVVQFAGAITRDAVRSMMQGLQNSGWRVQGVSGGGERTAAAYRLNEVRFATPEDRAAAVELAREVQSSNLVANQVNAVQLQRVQRQTPQPGSPGGARRLEVWISR